MNNTKGTYLFRSQICWIEFKKISKLDGFVFVEGKKINFLWMFDSIIEQRGYVNIYSGSTWTESEMSESTNYFVDGERNVYEKAKINLRTSDGRWHSTEFSSDEEMMKVFLEIKEGKAKTIDITNW